MTYGRNGYRGRKTSSRGPAARVERPNQRAGACHYCGETVPAGAGQLWRTASGPWEAVHAPQHWAGSPVSGAYAGGCPEETDRMNAAGGFTTATGLGERDRLARIAATWAAMHPAPVQAPAGADLRAVPRAAGPKYAYTASGARMTMASARCEDAPCCGCCD